MAKDKKDKEKKEIEPKEDSGIVIEETEDDILSAELSGDPNDFKKEVDKEAKKGRAMRVILPILFFIIVGAVVAAGTWYIKNQDNNEETGTVEEKIQTPPVVDESTDTKEATPDETKAEEPAPEETTEETTSNADYITYTVKSGDTLSGIANEYDMTSAELAEYNNISDPESLQIGQKIKIPQK
ncbi:MAG: LysM peptidoglycan-binding domain-containing protein [Patescibacteria group bacterium]|nr:LysM peptidoglycan-binding domain-containing protein [Patescibacteria group bacterium]